MLTELWRGGNGVRWTTRHCPRHPKPCLSTKVSGAQKGTAGFCRINPEANKTQSVHMRRTDWPGKEQQKSHGVAQLRKQVTGTPSLHSTDLIPRLGIQGFRCRISLFHAHAGDIFPNVGLRPDFLNATSKSYYHQGKRLANFS